MGQNLQRAMMTMKSPTEKRLEAASIKRAELENSILENQKKMSDMRLAMTAAGPGVPSTVELARDADGYYQVVPGDFMAQQMQSNNLLQWQWAFQNLITNPAYQAGMNLWNGVRSEPPFQLLEKVYR